MPALATTLLGQELTRPNVATWWCGEPESRRRVLDNFDEMAISGALFGQMSLLQGELSTVPGTLDETARAALREVVERRGMDYVGQEVVQLSTTPVWEGDKLVPRPFVLRVFAAATEEGWQIMPGGFCRISADTDARAISMGVGVQSADVWVLSSKPVAPESLLSGGEDVHIQRVFSNIPSRAADNLYWYGRYLERAEATLRVVRCLCARSIDMDVLSGNVPETIEKLTHLLVAWGAIAPEKESQAPLEVARHALADESAYGSGLSGIRLARNASSVIRERISIDASRLSRQIDVQFPSLGSLPSEVDVLDAADKALEGLAALSGLTQESMNRDAGWRFLDIGKRIERSILTCRIARTFIDDEATTEDLEVMLDLVDSQITYRSRYMTGVAIAPVRDMVMLDPYNPRSVSFQLSAMREHLAILPTRRNVGVPEEPPGIAAILATELQMTKANEIDQQAILAIEQRILQLADAIAVRYFPRRHKSAMAPETSNLS